MFVAYYSFSCGKDICKHLQLDFIEDFKEKFTHCCFKYEFDQWNMKKACYALDLLKPKEMRDVQDLIEAFQKRYLADVTKMYWPEYIQIYKTVTRHLGKFYIHPRVHKITYQMIKQTITIIQEKKAGIRSGFHNKSLRLSAETAYK